MDELHSELKRQLQGAGIDDLYEPPGREAWLQFVKQVNQTYLSADEDRIRGERSPDVSSQQMEELHAQLIDERDKLREMLDEKRQAQSEIRKAQGEAERARQAREAQAAFLANMSHELRTPLNAIIGYSELVAEDAEALGYTEVGPDLQKIRLAGKHLVSLISDVLDMSKIQAGKLELDIEEFPVSELIEDVSAVCEPGIRQHANRFVVDCSAQVGQIRTDRTKLRQILVNLLSNAGKFTDHGTVTLAVTTHSERDRDWLVFEISDTGIGIGQDKISEIFAAFTQADASTTRKYGGTGLGLTISKNFCEVLGGDIQVESTPGEGTTFRVKLPSGRSAAAAKSRLASETLQGLQLICEDSSGVDLLIIDDDPSTHELIQRFVRDRDVSVYSALSGDKGLEMARGICPGLIIVDIVMPEMDGWEVLAALKSEPDTADIPTVVGSITHDEAKANRLGAVDYLVKPIGRKRLDTILSRHVSAAAAQPTE